MFLVIFAAAIGVALGVLLLDGPAKLRSDLRAVPALGLGALFLFSAEWLPIPGKPGVFIVGTALLVVSLLQNRHLGGVGILAFGLFLTGFVVLINGYLPLRAEAASSTDTAASGLRQDESETTTLGILGDVIPMGPWVLSFGDLIGTAGAFIVGRNLVCSRAPTRARRRPLATSGTAANREVTTDGSPGPARPDEAVSAATADPDLLHAASHDSALAPEPVAISADEFLARYLELDETTPAKNPVIDLRDMPKPPGTNPEERFIRAQSQDDHQS